MTYANQNLSNQYGNYVECFNFLTVEFNELTLLPGQPPRFLRVTKCFHHVDIDYFEIFIYIHINPKNPIIDQIEIQACHYGEAPDFELILKLGLDYEKTLAYIRQFILIPYFWEAPDQEHLELMMSFYSGHSHPYDAYKTIATRLADWYQQPLASLNLLLRSL